MMRSLYMLSALVAVSTAIVCPPNYCDNVQQPELNCLGGVLKNAGFCGCTDHCAKVEFETCKPNTLDILVMGVPNTDVCDEGLECRTAYLGAGKSHSLCMQADSKDTFVSRRDDFMVCPPDACANVKQEELNCRGGVQKGGFCGCTNVCAKVVGESCVPASLQLIATRTSERCDEGLVCHTHYVGEGRAFSVCIKAEDLLTSKKDAIICPTDLCDKEEKKELNCKGSVFKKEGFCSCTDVCAMQEGEDCHLSNPFIRDFVPTKKCDKGLVCRDVDNFGTIHGKCVKDTEKRDSILCPTGVCDKLEKKELNCKGGVFKKGGFCGCTDACAMQEGEGCHLPNPFLRDFVPTQKCDEGLVCRDEDNFGMIHGKCVKETEKRDFIICPPGVCDKVEEKELNCKGGVVEKGGFCGCTDACAMQEGEGCHLPNPFFTDFASTQKCDEGLVCKDVDNFGMIHGKCVKDTEKRDSILCPTGVCDKLEKKELNCKGSVFKKGGFCGCTDACAMQEGEDCHLSNPFIRDFVPTQKCDEGLVCKDVDNFGMIHGKCVKDTEKRASPCNTRCRRKSVQCTLSLVIYEGQWFARCDEKGNFLTEQCNNKKECFWVDHLTGAIDESTRVLGSANCL